MTQDQRIRAAAAGIREGLTSGQIAARHGARNKKTLINFCHRNKAAIEARMRGWVA